MLIAVDFDHTLVDREEPLPSARWAMRELRDKGHKILIYSCNNPQWIERVLNKHDIPYDWIYDGKYGKPVCDAYIDDRGIGFNGNWSEALEELDSLDERRNKIKEIGERVNAQAATGKE